MKVAMGRARGKKGSVRERESRACAVDAADLWLSRWRGSIKGFGFGSQVRNPKSGC